MRKRYFLKSNKSKCIHIIFYKLIILYVAKILICKETSNCLSDKCSGVKCSGFEV